MRRTRARTGALLALSVLGAGCGRRHGLAADAGAAAVDADVEERLPSGDDTPDATAEPTDAPAPTSDARADGATGADADAAPLDPICDAGAEAGAWQLLGDLLGASARPMAAAPALALGEGGEPVVAWWENDQVFTSAWEETDCVGSWHALAPAVAGSFPGLASSPAGLVRAYMKSAESQLVVERWNGTAFVALGAPLDAQPVTDETTAPAIVIDGAGNPMVAWGAGTRGLHSNVQVARWNGAWTPLTDPAGVPNSYIYSSIFITPVSLVLAPDGTPLVAWPGFSRLTGVASFSGGTTWNAVGAPIDSFAGEIEVSGPVVRANAAGAVFVASMTHEPMGTTLHPGVFHLVAGAWTPLGDPPVQAGDGQDYDLTIDASGAPILIVAEQVLGDSPRQLFVSRWSGATWDAMPQPPVAQTGIARAPRLAVDGHGRRVIAWSEPPSANLVTGVIRVARTIPAAKDPPPL